MEIGREQTAEDWVDVEYIFLHGYISNTPSDRKVHVERQLRVDRSTWPVCVRVCGGGGIHRTKKNSDEGWRNGVEIRSVTRAEPALGGWGNWSRGKIPILAQLSESEEKHLRLRVKQPIDGSLNGIRIRQFLLQPYLPQTGTLVP